MADSLSLNDHLQLKERDDHRVAPDTGVNLYVYQNDLWAVDSNSNQRKLVDDIVIDGTLTVSSV